MYVLICLLLVNIFRACTAKKKSTEAFCSTHKVKKISKKPQFALWFRARVFVLLRACASKPEHVARSSKWILQKCVCAAIYKTTHKVKKISKKPKFGFSPSKNLICAQDNLFSCRLLKLKICCRPQRLQLFLPKLKI